MIRALLVLLVLIPSISFASHLYAEKEYQNTWCKKVNGITEYRLADGTRVDCLTDQYAIEFDFAQKWAEGIGQALYYADMTGRLPGVVLILEEDGDVRYLDRLQRVADRYGIVVWPVKPDDF